MGPRRRKGRKRSLARRALDKNKSDNQNQDQDQDSGLLSVVNHHHPYSESNREYLAENESSLMWFSCEKGSNVDAKYVEDIMPLGNRMVESCENHLLWLSPRQRRGGGGSDGCVVDKNRTAGQKQKQHCHTSIVTPRIYWGAGSGGGSKSNECSLNFEYVEDYLSPWAVARLLPPDLLSPSPMQRKDLFWPRNANEVRRHHHHQQQHDE